MSENVVIKKDRTVTVPASEAKIGVQYDHNVNVITFDCPRYPDDDRSVDMSTMQIYINYMLPDKTLGSYLAENVKVDTNNPGTIHFDWKITRNVTQVKGALQALVCIKKVDADGNELYHWNTDLIQSFRVGEGMECLETISSDYADVISQLLVNMNTVTGEFEALSADVTARTSEETLQGLVNNAASDEKLRTIVNTYMEEHPVGVNVDNTLSVSGDAADAKVTGDRISELKSDLSNLDSAVFGETIETDVTGEVLNGVIIDTRTGTESTKFIYSKCTDFIDVPDNADYYYTGKIFNYIGIAGYNSNGEFVASVLSDITENFTDYKLTIPDGVTKIRASSYSPSESVINPLQVVKKVKTSNLVDKVLILNNEVLILNEIKENITRINHIYVATTGSDTLGDGTSGNPFATIYHANEAITDATEINQYIIHVADGVYTDLQTRYAGVQAHENYEGIKCKPWVVYEGNVKHPENVVIQWDGKTGYGDEFNYNDHAVHFCPFHITGSNRWTVGHKEIRGFTFDCKNTRYALHVEMSGYGYGVTWKVSDCVFIWHGIPDCSDITYQIPAVGTGSGHYEKGHLLRCKIINDSGVTDGFRNHDSKWVYGSLLGNLPHIGAEIIIEDCAFNAGDSGNTNVLFRNIYEDGLVDGYNRFSVKNCIGINKLSYSLSGNATKCDWRAEIKCSDIAINQFETENLSQ